MSDFRPLDELRLWRVGALFLTSAVLVVSGCATAPLAQNLSAIDAVQGISPERDFRSDGPAKVERGEIADIAVGDCKADVVRYRPRGVSGDTPLIFAHGFLRSVGQHDDFARRAASWGITTYLVGLCAGGWNRAAAGTYRDLLRATADESGAAKVIYGGFSAGGLAAGLAAVEDSRAVGYLSLDGVDRTLLARELGQHADRLKPYGVFARPSRCNAQQVGSRAFATAGAVALEIAGATHCHFEAPTNLLCSLACGDAASTEEDSWFRGRVLAMATAYLRWRAGIDASPDPWWTPSADVVRRIPTRPD